jgi:tryptophan-rich sensory protein
MKKDTLLLIGCILIPIILGGISGFFTSEHIPTWYEALNKPWFNPPKWLFGPVWTVLYIMMGYASYLILKTENNKVRNKAITIYGIQLLLNFFWSIIFFYYKRIDIALIEIITMWIFINFTIISFNKLNKSAALLLLPYVVWVSFAVILNAYLFYLN